MKDIKVGDTVHVKLQVSKIDRHRYEDGVWFSGEDIVHVEPRPIKVGDKVRLHGQDHIYEVMGVCGDHLWVTFESQAPFTVPANRVTGVIFK